jgi:hypothetical protein
LVTRARQGWKCGGATSNLLIGRRLLTKSIRIYSRREWINSGRAALLALVIDSAYHSHFKSAGGGIQFHYEGAIAAGADKPARTSEKSDDPHIQTRCGV